MFSQSDTIHFSCHQCGKCCGKAPSMSFYDMIELGDQFIFQTAHNSILSYAKKPLETILLEHYQALGHTIMLPELEASLFYFVDFTAIGYPSYKACPKLKDNLCSIYAQRPAACRLSPIDSKYDDTQQWRTLSWFKKQVDENDWKCSFEEKDPIVFSQEQIYQPSHNALYFQNVDNIRVFTDNYIEFLSINGKDKQDQHFKAIFKAISNNNLMISDMVVSLQVARYNNIISENFAMNFIEKQIKLIEQEMLPALSFKRKEDRQTTNLYKKQKEEYLKAIKNNLFKDTTEDIFIG